MNKIGVVLLFIGSSSLEFYCVFINVEKLEFPVFMNPNNIIELLENLFELQLLERSDPWKQMSKNN